MIFHETAFHQMEVESKFLQVPLRPSTMNQTIQEAVKNSLYHCLPFVKTIRKIKLKFVSLKG